VRKDVFFGETELPVEDSQELSFDPVHVSLPERWLLAREDSVHNPTETPECSIAGIL
jgi:hypothetical protein